MLYVYFVESDNGIRYARDNRAVQSFASVYFEKDRRFPSPDLKRDRISCLYLVKYIHILLYILYWR